MSNDSLLGEHTQTTTEAEQSTTEAVETTQAHVAENATIEQPTRTQEEIQQEAAALQHTFLDDVSEDYRESLSKFKNVDDLAKSYINLEKMVGSSIRIPSEDATPETRKQFMDKIKDVPGVLMEPKTEEELMSLYNRLGRPETPDKYSTDDIIPAELIAGDESVVQELDAFRQRAHELGLTEKQAKGLMAMRMEQVNNMNAYMAQSQEAGLKALHEKWGADFDNRLAGAKNMINKLKEKYPDHADDLIRTNGNNPVLAHLLSELDFMYQEQGMIGQPKIDYGMTPEQAGKKLNELMSDKEFQKVWKNPTAPGHDQAMNELERLAALRAGKR